MPLSAPCAGLDPEAFPVFSYLDSTAVNSRKMLDGSQLSSRHTRCAAQQRHTSSKVSAKREDAHNEGVNPLSVDRAVA